MITFLIVTIYSLCEWSIMFILLGRTYRGVCIKMIEKIIFFINNFRYLDSSSTDFSSYIYDRIITINEKNIKSCTKKFTNYYCVR